MMATLIKRAKEPPVPPKQVEPSVPPAVNDVIMKCLQIKLERRYQTAGEILGRSRLHLGDANVDGAIVRDRLAIRLRSGFQLSARQPVWTPLSHRVAAG